MYLSGSRTSKEKNSVSNRESRDTGLFRDGDKRLGNRPELTKTLDVYAAYLPLTDRDAASRIGQLLATNVNRERQS